MRTRTFNLDCCVECSQPISNYGECGACFGALVDSSSSRFSRVVVKTLTVMQAEVTKWVDGRDEHWFVCDGVRFGITLSMKNILSMCNYQGVPVSSDYFGPAGLKMFMLGIEMADTE